MPRAVPALPYPLILPPVEIHELPRQQQVALAALVRKVAAKALIHGSAANMLTYVYLAGMYHALEFERQEA